MTMDRNSLEQFRKRMNITRKFWI